MGDEADEIAPVALTATTDLWVIAQQFIDAGVSYAGSQALLMLLSEAVARSSDGVQLEVARTSAHAVRLQLGSRVPPRGGWPLERAAELSDVWGTHDGTRTAIWVELELSVSSSSHATER